MMGMARPRPGGGVHFRQRRDQTHLRSEDRRFCGLLGPRVVGRDHAAGEVRFAAAATSPASGAQTVDDQTYPVGSVLQSSPLWAGRLAGSNFGVA